MTEPNRLLLLPGIPLPLHPGRRASRYAPGKVLPRQLVMNEKPTH